jgi:hypothetical protein
MDIIGSIKLIEHTLDKRYQGQTRSKPAASNGQHNVVNEKKRKTDSGIDSAWDEIQLGRNIDLIA